MIILIKILLKSNSNLYYSKYQLKSIITFALSIFLIVKIAQVFIHLAANSLLFHEYLRLLAHHFDKNEVKMRMY